MTRKRPASSPARARRPSAKLKSERIQGVAEKVPAASLRRSGPGLERVGPAEVAALVEQMPGWYFDEERSSFRAQIPMGPAVEIPVDGCLTFATAHETRFEVRLSEGAQHWTKARLEVVRSLHRGLAHLGATPAQAQPKEPR